MDRRAASFRRGRRPGIHAAPLLPMTSRARSTGGGGAVTQSSAAGAGGDGEHPRRGRHVTSRSTFTRGSGKKVLGYVITSVVVGQMVVVAAAAVVPSITPPPMLRWW